MSGEFTVHHIVSSYINRINEIDKNGPKLNSIIGNKNPDALKIAKQLDEELSSGHVRGKLHGIPVILKDNIDTADINNWIKSNGRIKSITGQFLVKKLKVQRAVILAKANLSGQILEEIIPQAAGVE